MSEVKLPSDLQALAESGLSEARRELEHTGGCTPLILVREKNGEIHKLKLEGHLANLMNSGEAKDHLFGWLRRYVDQNHSDAVLFITDSWMGDPTEQQRKALAEPGGREKVERAMRGKNVAQLAEEGWVERIECAVATLQTEEHVWIIQQRYDRNQRGKRIDWGKRDVMQFGQAEFQGRQKMFGDPARSEL